MFAIFLFAPQPVKFEFFIRPDVICPFFAALSFFLLVRFLLAWRTGGGSRRMLAFGMSAVFFSFVLPSLKPSYWLSAIFTTIPIWCFFFSRREKLLHRFLVILIPGTAVWLLLVLPEQRSSRSDEVSHTFPPQSVFSIHAVIIRKQIAADVATPDPAVPYSQKTLRSTLALLDEGIANARRNSPGHMQSLDCNADYLLYRDPFFTKMADGELQKSEPRIEFYRYYFQRAWRKMPGAMLHKVGIQLAMFYNLHCPAYDGHSFELKKNYVISLEQFEVPDYHAELVAWPPALYYMASVAELENRGATIHAPKFLAFILDRLGNCYMPGLIAWLATLPWLCWRADRRARFGLCAAILAVGYAYNFGNNLGIAILHTLEIGRYSIVQFATTLITETLTGIFLFEVFATAIPLSFSRAKKASYTP